MGDMDLPAGPPSKPGTTVSYLQPLRERERMTAEQRARDAEEVNRFFTCPAPVVPDYVKEAIKNAIYPSKVRTDGELFTALRPIDDPDAKAVLCDKKIKCGHPCQEPKIIPHECGLYCTYIKTFIRPCGHETYIYCHRETSKTVCTDKCGRAVGCGHRCRKVCHVDEPCPPTCEDFYCKNAHRDLMGASQPSTSGTDW